MEITYGKYTYGVESLQIFNYGFNGRISIGAFTSIAANVKIYVGQGKGHHPEFGSTYPFGVNHTHIFNNLKHRENFDDFRSKGQIIIGSDVWIGDGVTLTPGIKIGSGAIIATNSHVVKDVPPYCIVGGNPSKHIRYRFEPDIVGEFLKLRWWDLEDSKINLILPFLQSEPTIQGFKEVYELLKID